MDPKDRMMLQDLLDLTEENNKILKKLYSSAKWGRLFKLLYWFVILGIAFGSFYFVQQYIDRILDVYNGFKTDLGGVNSVVEQVKQIKQ